MPTLSPKTSAVSILMAVALYFGICLFLLSFSLPAVGNLTGMVSATARGLKGVSGPCEGPCALCEQYCYSRCSPVQSLALTHIISPSPALASPVLVLLPYPRRGRPAS